MDKCTSWELLDRIAGYAKEPDYLIKGYREDDKGNIYIHLVRNTETEAQADSRAQDA